MGAIRTIKAVVVVSAARLGVQLSAIAQSAAVQGVRLAARVTSGAPDYVPPLDVVLVGNSAVLVGGDFAVVS